MVEDIVWNFVKQMDSFRHDHCFHEFKFDTEFDDPRNEADWPIFDKIYQSLYDLDL